MSGDCLIAPASNMELVGQLFREYATDIQVDLCFQGFAQELATLPGAYAPPTGALLVACWGAAPAGCVALRPLDLEGGVCEMKRLYVRAPFRGLGVGRELAGAIIAAARRATYRAMRLDTLPQQMPAAMALYRHLGFRPIPAYNDNPLAGVQHLELTLEQATGNAYAEGRLPSQ